MEARLGLGPMSSEVMEATYMYSHANGVPLMLIASMNQINYAGGYVNGWTTRQYVDRLKRLQEKYPNANIKICRDHCGPNFSFQKLDPRKCIEDDIKYGFDLIHLDWSKDTNVLQGTREAALFALNMNPNIKLEIGTDAIGGPVPTPLQLEETLDAVCFGAFKPEFVVVNTGSLVKDYCQAGTFDIEAVTKCHTFLLGKGIKLKEHNADYLTTEEIKMRRGIVDAMNIAPQLGVIQTLTTLFESWLQKAPSLRVEAYKEVVWQSGDYRQWECKKHSSIDQTIMAGHYRFNTQEYRALQRALKHPDMLPYIIRIIDEYANN